MWELSREWVPLSPRHHFQVCKFATLIEVHTCCIWTHNFKRVMGSLEKKAKFAPAAIFKGGSGDVITARKGKRYPNMHVPISFSPWSPPPHTEANQTKNLNKIHQEEPPTRTLCYRRDLPLCHPGGPTIRECQKAPK